MDYNDNKKPVGSFYKVYRKSDNKSTFSGLQSDVINSLGSEKKKSWSSANFRFRSLKDSR